MFDELVLELQQTLKKDIEAIHVASSDPEEQHAYDRLMAVAENAPEFLIIFGEPWLDPKSISNDTLDILKCCARIHLYARILDDAIDENSPCYRKNLLRAQPIFWDVVQRIGFSSSQCLAQQAIELVVETVNAVQVDDLISCPAKWGEKNHHLLLLPLLLSKNNNAYQTCKDGLSSLIALVQAGDEWRQGEFAQEAIRKEFFLFLSNCLNEKMLIAMKNNGWHVATERIVWNAHQLLDVLSDIKYDGK
ncbi:hypothetical protein CXF72_13115 [Psychromonas sp. MB-3u-54]|uniref:hypothetical protein n=1 Tax=Psychromonas sp. MB-3u-54 TaxID=2058319 RepID=UPI000C3364BF|nr:hypothetical protein [Psychromonas sp. MB-3u-54]PKH02139.1 hypothetical protein CXF72_13115 [Psychromonas sp. MB-3u-54]